MSSKLGPVLTLPVTSFRLPPICPRALSLSVAVCVLLMITYICDVDFCLLCVYIYIYTLVTVTFVMRVGYRLFVVVFVSFFTVSTLFVVGVLVMS